MATQETSDEITRLYAATFNRPPDATGLAYWDAAVDQGYTVPQIAGLFATSPEFIQDYGALSDTAFVTQLYQNVLGRAQDAPGAAYWVNDLASGDTRGDVLNFFAQSPENIAHTAAVNISAAVSAIISAPVVQTPSTPSATVTPPVAVATPTPLPDPTVTGTLTATGPASFTLASPANPGGGGSATAPATVITSAAIAEASTFTFADFGGRVDISDLVFDHVNFITAYTGSLAGIGGDGQQSLTAQAGGTFVLSEHGAQVASMAVGSYNNNTGSPVVGIDPSNGYSFFAA